jgi:maltose alpha-D-glucosyltransferase / alpha-amylase
VSGAVKAPRRKRAEVSVPVGDESLWYKDALIYEVHVRGFYDADGDGAGDFRGLTQRLDYLADLGITAIWLLPFYPSPLRDDGYDIADYTNVHPDYGTLRDFKVFIREAHRRNLRVITELVCNHTSDQHPWFQRARRSPVGSVYRDFYVWSDTPDRYADVRVIFKDFETSNWTWDARAGAYYWHRFYSHQPDLNFENPRVREQIKKALDFWLELGVDGVRLDAVPYLFEREGTNCENLPETHAFLRELRAHVDANFADRMLLAEANQWPEDAVAYFGDGDECHMCFHFPVMPRMFMALRMEDRLPIYDILEQTPAIPDNAQWALFLRNHDELTLEMVTDEERDYMYRAYAHDPVARINLGIRRRLAPLLGNNRRRIELMNGLLFSLPGTPVLYYGDEIGMGDNFYLGDRNGVRTPMQWSGDRNAGFSSANRQRLYLPVITDPEYHYEAVNVDAQQNNPNSLLWWMKRLIALRKQHPAFGRGTLTFLHPENRRVAAFVRELDGEQILVVANLSRYVQYAELDLSAYDGLVPVEMFGRGEFPRLEQRPFFLTLGPHGFIWFSLEADPSGTGSEVRVPGEQAPTLQLPADLDAMLSAPALARLTAILPAYLRARRWFRSKARRIKAVRLVDVLPLGIAHGEARLAIFGVDYTDGEPENYVLPLALGRSASAERVVAESPQSLIAHVAPSGNEEEHPWLVYDALYDPSVARGLLEQIGTRKRTAGRHGRLNGTPTSFYRALRRPVQVIDGELAPATSRAEQSNTSIIFGDRLILKVYRRLEPGTNPDLEVGRVLTDAGFEHTPAVAGWLSYERRGDETAALGILQAYVPNQGDAWAYTLDSVSAYYERAATVEERPEIGPVSLEAILTAGDEEPPEIARETIGSFLDAAWLMGRRTAELHVSLASVADDAAFAPEPITELTQRAVFQSVRNQAGDALATLDRRLGQLSEPVQEQARLCLQLTPQIHDRLRAMASQRARATRIRVHGDLHAGQVLWTGRDFVIIDFEGEPGRPLSERRYKRTALVDVAGMLRSFHYAALGTLLSPRVGGTIRPEDVAHLEPWANLWYMWVAASFVRGYRQAAEGQSFLPSDDAALVALLELATLQKVLYELTYELNNRPDWVAIPLRGLLEMLGADDIPPAASLVLSDGRER